MNLIDIQNKTILLFGKSRAFSSEEFDSQLKFHNIFLTKEYSSEVSYIVEGRMMTPYEQIASENIYENGERNFITIDKLEKILAQAIDEDTLLMSLKLSHDKERLKSFIQNDMISDTLFFRLLRMYSWNGEDFFENDDNRDVTAGIIRRFYTNIEQNHNVEYATLGLMHLIVQCKDEKLIDEIALLEPLQNSFKNELKDSKFSIVTAIATHEYSSKAVIKMLVKKANSYVKTLIAMRLNCDENMQNRLYKDGNEDVLEALSYNEHLNKELIIEFAKTPKYAKNIAKYIKLDKEIFKLLIDNYAPQLAQNESLNYDLQKELISLHDKNVQLSLASNINIDEKFINELVSEGSIDINFAIYENETTPQPTLEDAYNDKANHFSLAHNKNTPLKILTLLAESDNPKVLEGLAKNESTPIDVLYQLQLDSRFERYVKENASFGKHIQTENIGWLV